MNKRVTQQPLGAGGSCKLIVILAKPAYNVVGMCCRGLLFALNSDVMIGIVDCRTHKVCRTRVYALGSGDLLCGAKRG